MPPRDNVEITLADSHLVVSLPGTHKTLSWALVGGGLRESNAVVWKEVRNADLGPNVSAEDLLRNALQHVGHPEATGLLTSAPLTDYCLARASADGVSALAVATVGLSNALAIGDPADIRPKAFGTINILAWISEELSDEASIEALSIATEARTSAVLAANVPSRVSRRPATGTGTDCIVVASPVRGPTRLPFAGKHTVAGSLIGRASYEAVVGGIEKWRKRSSKRV